MSKAQHTGVWLLSIVLADVFHCLNNGAKTRVLVFWISRDKVCLNEAHLFIKKWQVKLKFFNYFMGILKIIKMTLVYMCFSF